MDAASIALRLVSLVCELWPALSSFLESVTAHPDFAGESVAVQVRAILPEVSESQRAAEKLKGGA